jgi:hypothetical protein
MSDETPAEKVLDWKQIGALLSVGASAGFSPEALFKAWIAAKLESQGGTQSLVWNTAVESAVLAGETLHKIEEPFLPLFASFVAPILSGLFGADFDEGEFSRAMARGAGNRGATAIMEGFMRAIVGDTPAEIVPTDAGAKRIAAAAVQAELESQFNALVPDLLSHLLPFDVGHFEGLQELPEGIIRALGVSRLVRRALQPAVTVCCTTPATWYYNKLHRPTLLGASTLAKQITRNPAKRETWLEDLRRDGYSEERIEALLNEQAKFHSVTDLDLLVRAGAWSEGQAEKQLQDQGYDPDVAKTELLIEKLKRIAAFERSMASAGVDAYVAGRISEGELGGFITGTTISPQEKAQYAELASARRICSIQPLTPAEAKAAVHAGVLAVVDYRAALRRDGRDEEAITVLELMLRRELDKESDLEKLRADQTAERTAEKLARAAELAKRKAEIDAARKLARRGSEADLEAAAVRGLIPIARVAEVYAAKYDGDTVAILVDDLTARRADYIAQLQAAEDARKRAAVRNIDVGALEQAVLTHVISVGDFRDRLAALKFTAADADLLAATLDARLQAMHDAEVQREKAAAAAQIKHIDLGRFETLVRRGHRTLHDYAALLDSLGFEEGSRAAMGELLQLHIDDDAAAAQLRADVAARSAAKGLTLEQFRRAVIVGAKPIAAFTPFLLQNGFTTDAAAVLLAELQFDVDEAVAARARRAEADRRSQAPKAPLSDIRRAARLGLIRVDAYFARLRVDGYTEDEVAIESDLLAAEMARERALVAAAAAREAAAPAEALTLGQIAAAVRVGASTIGAYTARALALGFSTEDADTLTATLQAELDATAAARERRATLIAAGGDRELARADVEKAVRKGVKTLDEYGAWLTAAGYTDDDAALLVAVLQADVDAGAGDDGAP